MNELDEAKATLKQILRDVVTRKPMDWERLDNELDWAIDQIVRAAAEKGRGQIQ